VPAEDDWIELYRRTVRPLYAWISRRAGGDRELAEDVTQEAWLRALAAWRRRGLPAAPLAWLETTAGNLIRNHYRGIRPARLGVAEIASLVDEPRPTTPDAAVLLHRGLARLRAAQRRLIEAHHLDGQSIAAIAGETGLSERAVEGRLRRSRLALKRKLVALAGGTAAGEIS